MKDFATKRAGNSKTVTGKEGALADFKTGIRQQKTDKAQADNDLGAFNEYAHSLHLECDWLIKYFDMHKDAHRQD